MCEEGWWIVRHETVDFFWLFENHQLNGFNLCLGDFHQRNYSWKRVTTKGGDGSKVVSTFKSKTRPLRNKVTNGSAECRPGLSSLILFPMMWSNMDVCILDVEPVFAWGWSPIAPGLWAIETICEWLSSFIYSSSSMMGAEWQCGGLSHWEMTNPSWAMYLVSKEVTVLGTALSFTLNFVGTDL